MEKEEKSAYIEVLDYNGIVSFRDNQSLIEALSGPRRLQARRVRIQQCFPSPDDKFGRKLILSIYEIRTFLTNP